MDKSITNLLRLIDSGKIENIRMAAQLAVNLPMEYQWLRKYLEALDKLPPKYASWYHLYSEVARFGDNQSIQVLVGPYTALPIGITHRFLMHEITENVANELHFMMFRVQPYGLYKDVEYAERAMSSHYPIPPDEIRENRAITLASKLLALVTNKY